MTLVGVETNGFEFATVMTDNHVTSVGAHQDVCVRLVPGVAGEVGTVDLDVVSVAELAPLDAEFLGFVWVFFVPDEVLETVRACN